MGELIMNTILQISVTELLILFKESLSALIPWIEKVKIRWKEGEAYDDWDNIAEALYKNIVCASLIGEVAIDYPLANYNFIYDNYSILDFIEVKSKVHTDKRMAFISFSSNKYPLDNVKIAYIDSDCNNIGCSFLENNDLTYVYIKKQEGREIIIDKIKVTL